MRLSLVLCMCATPLLGAAAGLEINGGFETLDGAGVTGTIGGTPLVNLSIVDATTITGLTPAGTAGAADVVVATPFGAAGAFTHVSNAPRFRREDCNNDASTNLADAITLLGHLFAGTGPLPAPFPAYGENPTQSLSRSAHQSGC